jgi:hypothetical protein
VGLFYLLFNWTLYTALTITRDESCLEAGCKSGDLAEVFDQDSNGKSADDEGKGGDEMGDAQSHASRGLPGHFRELWIRGAVLAGALGLLFVALPSAAQGRHAPKTFLLVWASDKGTDDHIQDPDFLAVIDADAGSDTYGKVLTTAPLEAIPGKHLLSEVGLIPGLESNLLNEAHHFNAELYVGADQHKYLGSYRISG